MLHTSPLLPLKMQRDLAPAPLRPRVMVTWYTDPPLSDMKTVLLSSEYFTMATAEPEG